MDLFHRGVSRQTKLSFPPPTPIVPWEGALFMPNFLAVSGRPSHIPPCLSLLSSLRPQWDCPSGNNSLCNPNAQRVGETPRKGWWIRDWCCSSSFSHCDRPKGDGAMGASLNLFFCVFLIFRESRSFTRLLFLFFPSKSGSVVWQTNPDFLGSRFGSRFSPTYSRTMDTNNLFHILCRW